MLGWRWDMEGRHGDGHRDRQTDLGGRKTLGTDRQTMGMDHGDKHRDLGDRQTDHEGRQTDHRDRHRDLEDRHRNHGDRRQTPLGDRRPLGTDRDHCAPRAPTALPHQYSHHPLSTSHC